MIDIYLAILIVLLISAGLGMLAFRVASRRGKVISISLILLAVTLLSLNIAFFRNSLWPAHWLSVSNLIVWADPSPELAAVIAGAALALLPGSLARRSILLAPLLTLALWSAYRPLLEAPPTGLQDRWKKGVCRQTSPASCAAASAATLLRTCGINTTEEEMARLCLTTSEGTSSRGLYRGLKLKTAGTPWRVAPFQGDVDALWHGQAIAILPAH